jgi:NADPH:quinone reductase-like Zn-dependent oxidoreductase
LASATLVPLNKLHFIEDLQYDNMPLAAGEIDVQVQATGLNFRDVLVAMGHISGQNIGLEGAGIVNRTGSDITYFRVGDRVCFGPANSGSFATFARLPAEYVGKIPNSLTMEEAASVPVNFITALYSLRDVARLKRGESVLIHAAAGGTGQAALQLARLIGAEIYATVSTIEKRQMLVATYGISEDHIFSSRDLSFAAGVKKITSGRGVDVVLNSLSGEALHRSWECLAPYGRFIQLGKRDAMSSGTIDMSVFLRNTVYAGVDVAELYKQKPAKCESLLRDIMDMFASEQLLPVHDITVLRYTDLEAGFRLLQSGKSMGKVVFKQDPDDVVMVRLLH